MRLNKPEQVNVHRDLQTCKATKLQRAKRRPDAVRRPV